MIFADEIIRLWAGPAAMPPFALVVWMAVWRLMISTMLVGSCVLNATGHLKGMTIYGTVTALLNLILSILFAKMYGITGVAAATAIAYAVSSYVPTFIEVRSVVRKFPTPKRDEPRPMMPVSV